MTDKLHHDTDGLLRPCCNQGVAIQVRTIQLDSFAGRFDLCKLHNREATSYTLDSTHAAASASKLLRKTAAAVAARAESVSRPCQGCQGSF